jgi:DNA-binding transcriptional regulator of glucitol operon
VAVIDVTATTTGQAARRAGPAARWAILLRPRWLAWHSFVIIAAVGMLFLGDWQLHRAESGNELSWAYTFEWPLFSAFTVYFWIKSLRDELREAGAGASAESESSHAAAGSGGAEFTAAAPDSSGTATAVAPGASARTDAGPAAATPVVQTARRAPVGHRADSWDATSWDATSWDATSQQAGSDAVAKPVDIARATPADGEAYLARLMAEVQRTGRRRGAR